ncbi:karyopherin beta [Gryganskiella cystojenkinii]|nr:karyopherin beta [Gryganskiella cystojenkinii]
MSSPIGEILLNTLSPDQLIRETATRQLETAAEEDFKQYVVMLCQELSVEQSQARIPAGLALKNALTARETVRRDEMSARWLGIDADTRLQIKNLVLTTLGTNDLRAGLTAAQVVAAIAAIELPIGEWEDVIRQMLQTLQTSDNNNLKQCTFKAIGFVCEATAPIVLATQANSILTAVVQGARKEEPSEEVRLAAIEALYNSLEFVKENFGREGERNYIMQVICEATQSKEVQVQIVAFECLVRIMQLYYDKMPFYMQKAVYGITVQGMKHENERVALQAVEFWSTVCEEEIDIEMLRADAMEAGEQPNDVNYHFAKLALSETLPVLLQLMAKQDEDDDEDDWNLSMAAGTCLSLTAQCVGDECVAPVIQFVEANIRHQDWQYREASVMAFGSILDGPSEELLVPPVELALPFLIEMMNDPVVKVKDTTAWTLGRVSQSLIECIRPETHLQPLIEALIRGLQDNNRIVSNCCLSLMNLAEQLEPQDQDALTSPMSPFFEGIITALMQITGRNTNEAFSRTSAYEAISVMVSHSAKDTFPTISALSVTILDRLEQSIALQNQIVGVDERNAHSELQSNICSVLTNIIRRVHKDIAVLADRIMTVLLQLLGAATKHSTILEDAFLAVGALTTALEADFGRYLGSFAPYLFSALANHEEYQLCSIAVGLIGDICRSLGPQSATYCNEFMSTLLQNLQSPVLHRNVKPAILSCFGDIALAIEGQFGSYLDVTMNVLAQACTIRASPMDGDMIDYVNQLREGIVDAYVGIVQGLKAGNNSSLLAPHLTHVFEFLNTVYNDPERSDTVLRSMIGLIGDLAESFPGGEIKSLLQADWVSACLKEGRSSRQMSVTTKEVARWAKEMVKRATM